MSGETQSFDPLAEARHNADGHRKRYYDMVGDTSEFPDHGTFSKAHEDFGAYLEQRPFEDAKGNIHNAANGQFAPRSEGEESYYDRLARASVGETDQFTGKSLEDLAHMVADARANNDKTGADDAEDAFSQHFVAMAEKYNWPDETVSSRIERFDRIMKGESPEEPSDKSRKPEAGQENQDSVEPAIQEAQPVEPLDEVADDVEKQLQDLAAKAKPGEMSPEDAARAAEVLGAAEAALKSGEHKGFDPDTELAAAQAQLNAKGDQLEADAKRALEEKYPELKPRTTDLEPLGTETSAEHGDKAEEGAKSLDDVIAALKETDAFKKASPEDRQIMIDNATNKWIAANAEKKPGEEGDVEKKEDKRSDEEKRLDAFLESNQNLTEGLSDKEKESIRRILLVLVATGVINKERLPQLDDAGKDKTEGDDTEKKALEERKKHYDAEMQRITGELENSELSKNYKDALAQYAEAKADFDTKGFFGRRKREQLLGELEKVLANAKLEYAKALVTKKNKANLYEGEENAVGQSMSNDMFDEVRKIDPESRGATEVVRQKRVENRNWLQKTGVAVGRWFNWGNKFGRFAKNVTTGAVAGGLTGFGAAFAGITGFPVTAAAAVGSGLLVRAASASAYLDESLRGGAYKKALIEDQYFKNFIEAAQRTSGNVTAVASANALVGDILGNARKMGMEQNKQARRRATARMGEYTLGFAIGGFAGNMIHNGLAANAPGNTAGSPKAPQNPGLPKSPGAGLGGLDTNIRPGEGGGEFAQKLLAANGIHLNGAHAIQAWDQATHGANALDIFTQNGAKLDTYAMVGKFGGHAGLAYPGHVTVNPAFAQQLIDAGKALV